MGEAIELLNKKPEKQGGKRTPSELKILERLLVKQLAFKYLDVKWASLQLFDDKEKSYSHILVD